MLSGRVTKLSVVKQDQAYRLAANENFTDENGTERMAGDEWLLIGPCTYYPRKEVEFVNSITASIIMPGSALRVKATRMMTDKDGHERVAGEGKKSTIILV